jgi:CDP-L-myo-inositol myo-inositolphosphotransferase
MVLDPRLTVSVVTAAPPTARSVGAVANLLLHRGALAAAARGDADAVVASGTEPPTGTAFGFAAVEVVDSRSARRAERALFRSLRKPQDGWTARWLNRYVSLAISRFLVRTRLTPNQVSVGILAIGLYGAFLASRGTYSSMLAGAALFQAQSILDGCDGEMSRVSYRGSHLGEWLDTIGDDVTNYAFFAGAAAGLHAATGSGIYLAAGLVTVLSGVTASLIEYRYLLKIGSGDLLKYPTSQTATGTGALAAIAPLFKRDTFVFLTLVAAALDLLGPMLVVFAAAAVGILANVLAAEVKMARERRQAAPPRP